MTMEAAVAAFVDRVFPPKAAALHVHAAKLAEEAGEVCGALVKLHEGRGGPQEVADELGDVLLVVSTIAGHFGWTVDELRAKRWAYVQQRAVTGWDAEGTDG